MVAPIQPPVVLTVAGLGPFRGRGDSCRHKDDQRIRMLRVAAVTSLTFQNTQRVYGTLDQSGETARRQIEPLFEDFEIAALKTGMLPSAEVAREVAAMIRAKAVPVVVVDPVLRSSSGFDLVEDQSVERADEMSVSASVSYGNAQCCGGPPHHWRGHKKSG